MAQYEIEIILSRHLAGHLQTPAFIVDPAGNLIYYNGAAEPILGKSFAETGPMSAEVWGSAFNTTDEDGAPLPLEGLPLAITIETQRPAHRRFYIVGLDNVQRYIETTALPLIGQSGRFLGAMALFWELDE